MGVTHRKGRHFHRPLVASVLLAAAVVVAVGPGTADGAAVPSAGSEVTASLPAAGVGAFDLGSTAAAGAEMDFPTIPTTPNLPYSDCSDTDGVPFATGLTPLPCAPTGGIVGAATAFGDYGTLFLPVTVRVGKTRTLLDLGRTLGRVQNRNCTQVGTFFTPCPAGFVIPGPPVGVPSASVLGVTGYVFVQSPLALSEAGVSPQFGVVAQQQVSLLAFGSIPATATLTITQRYDDTGTAQPFRVSWGVLSAPSQQVGQTLPGYWSKFGPLPLGATTLLADDLLISGSIRVSISDVAIDGVPLGVGSQCHADTTLALRARGGWLPPPGEAEPGEPGEFNPFFPPGYLHADVDVPAFTGCVGGSGGSEVFDPLITGLVSGADNRADLTQSGAYGLWGCLIKQTNRCATQHPPVLEPNKVPLAPS